MTIPLTQFTTGCICVAVELNTTNLDGDGKYAITLQDFTDIAPEIGKRYRIVLEEMK